MSRSGLLVRGAGLRFGAARPYPAQKKQRDLKEFHHGPWDATGWDRMKGHPNLVTTIEDTGANPTDPVYQKFASNSKPLVFGVKDQEPKRVATPDFKAGNYRMGLRSRRKWACV